MPDFRFNLLSVSKLATENDCIVKFLRHSCVIQDSFTDKILVTGKLVNGLYCFSLTQGGDYSSALNSFSLWHQRFGHPYDIVLNVLKSDLNLHGSAKIGLCDVCHKSKQTRELFPMSDHVSKRNFELVHYDVWGPYKVPSHDGFRFFLTLVDDRSRTVWVYFIKPQV